PVRYPRRVGPGHGIPRPPMAAAGAARGGIPVNEPETTRPAAAEPAAPEALPDLPCEVCRDLIPLVQDGAASPRSVQLVGRHIEHCESCRAFWQADAPPPAPDDGRVLARIHRRLRLVQIAALAAGTLVGLWLTS